jgi:DNA-binding response OmpR family regulator
MRSPGDKVRKILIVEDEPAICEICLKVLTGEGFEVEIAANGEKGEEKLKEKDYDLVILDLRTPVMDGKQLYKHISEEYPGLASRVIFTSGEVIGGDIQGFLELAGRPFLPKPFTPKDLKKIVIDALGPIEE